MDSIAFPNPWKTLPLSPPFVLLEDREPLRACSHFPDETALHFELLPEPFVGHPDAPVFLLGLNPGFSPLDAAAHANVRFARRLRANLTHEPHPNPFYLLDPALSAPGRGWWERVLKQLVAATARDRVMANVCCVEFFPYHSRKFAAATPRVPSQSYGFALVRRAMHRGAVVIIMRSQRLWLQAIPELEDYPRRHRLNSVQNVAVTPRNCPDGFLEIVSRLESPEARAVAV